MPPSVTERNVSWSSSEAGLLRMLRLELLLRHVAGEGLSSESGRVDVEGMDGWRRSDGLDSSMSVDGLLEVDGRRSRGEAHGHVGKNGKRSNSLGLDDELSLLSLEILDLLLKSDLFEKERKGRISMCDTEKINDTRSAYLLSHHWTHLTSRPSMRSRSQTQQSSHSRSTRSRSSHPDVLLSTNSSCSSVSHLLESG